jgi:predicted ArsR family transcriptional regulator
MTSREKRTRSPEGTKRRIVELIRRSPMTAPEIASRLSLTYHAVRLHLLALERDGTVRVVAERGATRPASVFDVAPGVEAGLSRAYVPFASHLTRVLTERLPKRQLDRIMRDVGQRLASSFPRPAGSLRERAAAASTLLHELGAPNEVRIEPLRIQSSGCLLAEAVQGQSTACQAMAAFLGEFLHADVREHCDRSDITRPRCCFEIRRAS